MSEQSLPMADSAYVVRDLIAVIRENRDYLSEIDAAIGDGDHGINMSKGFSQCAERLDKAGDADLPSAFNALAESLMDGIGGSMGPLYGSFFMSFGETFKGHDSLDAALFGQALRQGLESIGELGEAKVGDKTLVDTLQPATDAFEAALAHGADFLTALQLMSTAAEKGKDSTKDMQARIGRAARLGERSIGVIDAGATSCFLILRSMAQSISRRLLVS
jgi:dihydroxyacetone kinase-like protein